MKKRQKEFLGGVSEVCALAEDLLDGKRFLLSSEPSLADFALFGSLHPLKHAGLRVPAGFPRLRAWHKRVGRIAR
jgi:glutathione S-transferase